MIDAKNEIEKYMELELSLVSFVRKFHHEAFLTYLREQGHPDLAEFSTVICMEKMEKDLRAVWHDLMKWDGSDPTQENHNADKI